MSDRVKDLFHTKMRKVASAYERNVDIKKISQQIGVSAPTISKWLIKEGYKRKKRGRIPAAMKARVKDLSSRGWNPEKISSLLNLNIDQVFEFSKPIENPILGGEKDPLKVKDQKKKKKKISGRKKGRPKKINLKKGEKWPPDRHKCNKHWKPLEKSYVLDLMEGGAKPLFIYKRMRASRNRQMKIWRESGGKGRPPNFEPPKIPTLEPEPSIPQEDLRRRHGKAEELYEAAEKRLKELEREAIQRQKRIAELEARAAEEQQKIDLLEKKQKKLLIERREKAERLAQARAVIERRKLKEPERRRVLPESYEAEVLGLKPGTLIEPGKPGRPAIERPDNFGGYADNGRYFTVSNEWADLEDAGDDELALFADFLTLKKFPAKVERGDQPKAYFESTWPKSVEEKWNKAVDDGLTLLDKYRDRKNQLKSKKMFSKPIAQYLAKAYSAYADISIPEDERKILKDDLADDWARIKKIDKLIMIFAMKAVDSNGPPTSEGVERGRAARVLLEKESKSAARKLAQEQESRQRKALREEERKEVEGLLAKARKSIGPAKDES